MHPSTALASVLVDELVRGGVREAVLAPGSRSAPLAYALHEADRAGRLRLHVRVDERSAGFLALGMAKASGLPVPVVTTSGTAVANLHPAVLEAHHSGVPLVVVSADRPAELRGTGANQTTVQTGIFGPAVRWEVDLPAPERRSGQVAHWRSTVCRGLAAARGSARGGRSGAGPVHLNIALRDPLAPVLASPAEPDWPEPLDGRADAAPWVSVAGGAIHGVTARTGAQRAPGPGQGTRTLVLLGDLPDPELSDLALDWAQAAGWPVLAEPFGRLPVGRSVVPHGVLVAGGITTGSLPEAADLAPDRVVVVGRLTLFRELGALLRRPGVMVEHISATADWTDPSHVVLAVHPVEVLASPPGPADGAQQWVEAWQQAGTALTPRVTEAVLDPLTGPGVAAAVCATLSDQDTLVLGSSNGPRDLALALGVRPQVGTPRVLANRGLAGIDGMVSTAVGTALVGSGRTVALIGDLTFLHDTNGLIIGPDEPRPDLTVVVLNDDGGGIFATLEYGDPARTRTPAGARLTERLFGTPHGTDLAALCQAHGIPHTRAGTLEELDEALAEVTNLAPGSGIQVVEVRVDRSGHRALRDRLR